MKFNDILRLLQCYVSPLNSQSEKKRQTVQLSQYLSSSRSPKFLATSLTGTEE
jgi:hypothetical protein